MKVIAEAKVDEDSSYYATKDEWTCDLCTFKNKMTNMICNMCEQGKKPTNSQP